MRTQTVLHTCVLMLAAVSAPALQHRAFDAATHLRFSSGYPAAPQANPTFLASTHDLSGVGWKATTGNHSYTLISPCHFVGANHLKPAIGSDLVFRGRDNVLRQFTVAARHAVTNDLGEPTDLFVGELTQPIEPCDEISYYPVLDLAIESEYVGRQILVYGRSARMGRSTVGAFHDFGADPITGSTPINTTRMYSFLYSNTGVDADDCHAEVGDSGSPVFVEVNGEVYVIGIHSAVLSTGLGVTTFDTFVPHYLPQLDAIVGDDGHTIARSPQDTFAACLSVELVSPKNIAIQWAAIPGRGYTLESSTDTRIYTNFVNTVMATSIIMSVTHTSPVERTQFYRLFRMPAF